MRWRDLGLALLAVVAAGLTVLTFRGVTAPDAPLPSGAAARPAVATSGPRAGLDAARAVLAGDDPVVVAALGDSTGNETWEWVYGWGRLLGASRPVSVVSWNEWTEDGYIEPRVLSEAGDGSPVVVWSGHHTGARAGYVAEHLEDLLPEEPDLVILNYGHNNTVEDVREELEGAVAAVRSVAGADLPVVLTLQQPQAGDVDAAVRDEVRAVADEQGLGLVDVAAAFAEAGDLEDLLADDVHPNEEGAAVWAQAVAEALGTP